MWKNEDIPAFVQYLRDHNAQVMRETGDPSKKVSFYGLDLYSLHRSAAEVLRYLERVDPAGAKAARKQYVDTWTRCSYAEFIYKVPLVRTFR